MAITGWVLDKSASVRANVPEVLRELKELTGSLFLCPMGELEYLYAARSARDYDELKSSLRAGINIISAPVDVFERALQLQLDLAHHHGMWHRTAIGDLLIAETALYHEFGVVHVDGDFDRIAEVRPLRVRRLSTSSSK